MTRADRGVHWGALLFTFGIAIAVLPLIAARLLAPLPPVATPATFPDDAASASPEEVRTPLPQELHSRWYTQSRSPRIAVGDLADITVQFRNIGHTSWIRGTAAEIRLGETGPRPLPPAMKADWPYPDRPAIQSEPIVHEHQLVTFTFKVVGVSPGTYRLSLRPVVDGVTWLEDDGVFVDITVTE